MSDLYWLHSGWKSATCPYCGVNIWDSGGDPDWGACYDCFSRQHEPEPTLPMPTCDICKQGEACAGVGRFGVCSQECNDIAETIEMIFELMLL